MCLWLFVGFFFSPSGAFLCLSQIKLQFKHQMCRDCSPLSLSSRQFLYAPLVLFSTTSEGPVGIKQTILHVNPQLLFLVHWFSSWSRATSTPTIVFETKLSPPEYSESSLSIVAKSWKPISVKRFGTLSCWQIIVCYRCVQKYPDTWPSLHSLEFVRVSIMVFLCTTHYDPY